MGVISPTIIGMVAASVFFQVIGVALLPLTRGLTQPVATAAAAAAFLIGIGLMARLAHAGVNLSLLVPILAATVPMGAIAVGVFFYGEGASLAKIGTLVIACILIGVANVL